MKLPANIMIAGIKLISFVFDVKIKYTLALWPRKHNQQTHLGLDDDDEQGRSNGGSDLFGWCMCNALITAAAPAQAYRIVRSPKFYGGSRKEERKKSVGK